MSDSPTQASSVKIEDLVALNDEIAALVRAGVPLELGLKSLGAGVSGELRKLADQVSQEMDKGMSLPEALESTHELPPLYRAVVECGLRADRLPEALERLSDFAQAMLELRRRIAIAMMYPGMVLLLAYGLFVLFLVEFVPRLAETYVSIKLPATGWIQWLLTLRDSLPLWGFGLPVLVLMLVVSWKLSRRTLLTSSFGIPGVATILRNFHLATFADLLSMLIDHKIPLPEAFKLASDTTGDKRIQASSQHVIDALNQGRPLADALERSNLPAFMKWMMVSSEAQGTMNQTLQQIADLHRRRAAFQADWLKLLLPLILVVVIGGGSAFCYALSLFGPLSELLQRLDVT